MGGWVGGWVENHATSWSNLQDVRFQEGLKFPSWTRVCQKAAPVSKGLNKKKI